MTTTLAFGVIIDINHANAADALTLATDNPVDLGIEYLPDSRAFIFAEQGAVFTMLPGNIGRPAQFELSRPGKLYASLYPILDVAGGAVVDSGLLMVTS